MKTIRAVVAIMDGVPDIEGEVFDLGSLQVPEEPVSVCYNFDLRVPVGRAKLIIDGDKLIADITLAEGLLVGGLLAKSLYPALGGSVGAKSTRNDGSVFLGDVKVTCLGLCEYGNTDKRIEPLKLC
jgi:hypothetical protein